MTVRHASDAGEFRVTGELVADHNAGYTEAPYDHRCAYEHEWKGRRVVTARDRTPETSERAERAETPELETLERGTEQHGQLRVRLMDIAWTALCTVLALWVVWSIFDVVNGATNWAYSAVAWTLLAIALGLRVATVRRRTRA
jgi:hypothetical protein